VLTDATSEELGYSGEAGVTMIAVFGPRQDYTFQTAKTYYIAFNLLSMSSNRLLKNEKIIEHLFDSGV
jgi:hypothetical protein